MIRRRLLSPFDYCLRRDECCLILCRIWEVVVNMGLAGITSVVVASRLKGVEAKVRAPKVVEHYRLDCSCWVAIGLIHSYNHGRLHDL